MSHWPQPRCPKCGRELSRTDGGAKLVCADRGGCGYERER